MGRSLSLSGRIPQGRGVLLEAMKYNKQKRTEIHRLLADAYLHDANPQLEKALSENELFLADRRLPAAARHLGLLRRSQILLRLGRPSDCTAMLDKIPPDARHQADAIIIRGQVLMAEARLLKDKAEVDSEDQIKIREKYKAAIKTLRYARSRETFVTQTKSKAMYLNGL